MEHQIKSKLASQLRNMQRIALPPNAEGYTIPQLVALLNKDLALGIASNTQKRKVISRKFSREFERHNVPFKQVSERVRYYKTSDCDNMLNSSRLRTYLYKELLEREELLQEYKKYEKGSQKIEVSVTGKQPQQRPLTENLSEAELLQQIERIKADIEFHEKSGNQKRQEEGLSQAFEAAISEAKQRCLLDALNRLTSDRLEEFIQFDEDRLAHDVWSSFAMDNVFPESYDLAAADKLREPSNYYSLSRIEELGEQLKGLLDKHKNKK